MKAYLIFDDKEKQTRFTERVWEYIKANGKEIEIPKRAQRLYVAPIAYGLGWDSISFPVPMPIPKAKVKKTVYLHVQNHNGRTVYSVHDGNTAPSEAYPVEIEVEE